MKVDQRRTCYNCKGFVYMARHCRNRRVEEEKRIEYGGIGVIRITKEKKSLVDLT